PRRRGRGAKRPIWLGEAARPHTIAGMSPAPARTSGFPAPDSLQGVASRNCLAGVPDQSNSFARDRYSPRLEKLLYLAGDNEYERFDLTGKAVGLIAVQNAYSLNSEFKTELLPGDCGRHRRYAT